MTTPTDPTPDPRYVEAMANLDLTGNVMAQGAAIAPDFVMRTLIALRSIMERHKAGWYTDRGVFCAVCAELWPCDTTTDALVVLGVDLEPAA